MKTRNGSWTFGFLLVLCLLILFQGRATADAPNSDSPLGANLHIFSEWSTEYTMVNAFKQSSPWLTQNWTMWNTGELGEIAFDADGWPRSLTSTTGSSDYQWIATLMFDGLGSHYPEGFYTVVYDGTGTLEYAHDATLVSHTPGKDIIKVDPEKPSNGILLKITATDPDGVGDYIRNIRVYMPGFDETTTQTFHPTFLDNISKYKVVRFMDWQRINWSVNGPMRSADDVQEVWTHPLHDAIQNPYYVYPTDSARSAGGAAEWDSRSKVSHARYSTTNGVPVELMVKLANELDADAWFNMPHHASDEYMMQFALMVRSRLEANRRVYVELSNEVWNSGFYQSQWFEEQGKAEWPNSTASDLEKRLSYFGKRSAEMCDIWELAFGSQADRVTCVIATQATNPWIGEKMLNCPLWDQGPCHAHHVDAVAIAPYFGQHLGREAYYDVVDSWTGQFDNGLGQLFAELEHGNVLTPVQYNPKVSLQEAKQYITEYANLADGLNLDLVAYEGGQHLVGVQQIVVNDTSMTELFIGANRDPRMANLYADYYAHWRDEGGKMFMHYASLGAYSKFGNWGAQEFADSVGMPKIAANHLFIDNNSCNWEACETPASYTPTAVALNSSTAASPTQLVYVLLFSLLVGTTAWLKRS